ncbi:hypothetical protein BCR36DRAFT_583659 [Piromyces finnis]|uniref:Coth-domain-containing protein n=1 Tax=Piromyces finnis TaxID=1754191 RepID=A0A1Y1V942_9FUNG|nr:hypothetical protein BCR36DRAFT_583659 [Piromyces finnis]|eukprot:ORX50066.1 hypothetical protein BCR36DRAFT_583659 [Piromyces finnis]
MKSTYNEFFERKETIKPLKQFKHPPTFTNWTRTIGTTKLFDDSYIPTIHIFGNNTEELFHDPYAYETIQLGHVKFYLKNSVESFTDVTGKPKNRGFSKFQIKLKLGKNERTGKKGIKGRNVLKLRNGGEDPLNLRQLIYGNIIRELGMPSIHSVMCRVYYNKKPVGFYTLQESATSKSFLKNEFYYNPETDKTEEPKNLGYVLDGTCGSDFEYHPNDEDYYSTFETNEGEDYSRIIPFTKALSKLNTKSEKAIKEFEEKWFDIDTFHKAMAMEYLTGDWDGYWLTTSNFAVYDDPLESTNSTFKFYFITQDHDETFGVGLCAPINSVGKKFPQQSYTTQLNRTWKLLYDDPEHRTLVDRLIGSSSILQKRFQNILVGIVENVFNPVAFKDVVSTYYDRFKPEVKWDYSIERDYQPVESEEPGYTYSDWKKNFDKGVGGLQWGLYEWVSLRAEAIKKELCVSWEGDENPPSKSCVPKVKF